MGGRKKMKWCTFNSFEDETESHDLDGIKSMRIFQFLWGWNKVLKDAGYNIIIYNLSIPLRMKPDTVFYLSPSQVSEINFQFLWGWNNTTSASATSTGNATFQFLWGWNVLDNSDNDSVDDIFFQFLWGWNRMKPRYTPWLGPRPGVLTFNSFEDETQVGRTVPNADAEAFNSFEDETLTPRQKDFRKTYFQFLWGWNAFRNTGRYYRRRSFNSFEDETTNGIHISQAVQYLSIPLRMKHLREDLV